MSRLTLTAVAALVVVIGPVALATLRVSDASAATIRTGDRWDHVDVLMSRDETSSVARGVAGGASVCWKVGAAAAALGMTRGPVGAIVGAIVGGSVCVAAVTTCAAQAYMQGRNAGMTFSPAWYGIRYWCWSY